MIVPNNNIYNIMLIVKDKYMNRYHLKLKKQKFLVLIPFLKTIKIISMLMNLHYNFQ